MVPTAHLTVLVYVPLAALLVSIAVQVITFAVAWGKVNEKMSQTDDELNKMKKELRREDGEMKFVLRSEHEKRGERCPQVICRRIDDLKKMVEDTYDKINHAAQVEAAIQVHIENFGRVMGEQQGIMRELTTQVTELKTQLNQLRNMGILDRRGGDRDGKP